MGKLVTALACLGATLALAGPAAADVSIGVNDDAGKYEQGASWFYPALAATGLRMNAITLRWDETSATAGAKASGVAVELDIYPLHSQALTNGAKCAPSRDPEACGDSVRIEQFG